MFRKGLLLLGALAFLAAPAAHAAGWSLGVSGGMSLPTGDFGDENKFDARAGFTVGLDACYHVSDLFAVGVDASWSQNKHGVEGETVDLGDFNYFEVVKDKFIVLQGGAHGKLMIPMQNGPVRPYGLLGLGIYNVKEDYEWRRVSDGAVFTDESEEAESETRFGAKIGLGAMYKAAEKVSVDVAANYNLVMMDEDVSGVSNLQFLTIRAGVVFHIVP